MSPVRRGTEYSVSVDPFSVPGLYSSLLEIESSLLEIKTNGLIVIWGYILNLS